MKSGDLVRIKPEFEGDDTVYIVREWNEDRGYISPFMSRESFVWSPEKGYIERIQEGTIIPQELVRLDMIEKI